MSDQDLACEVVHLLGLPLFTVPGGAVTFEGQTYYFTIHADRFLNDWRVAGALMEMFTNASLASLIGLFAQREVTARAITEACVEELRK